MSEPPTHPVLCSACRVSMSQSVPPCVRVRVSLCGSTALWTLSPPTLLLWLSLFPLFFASPVCPQIGETVFAEGQAGFKPLSATQMKKGKVFENIAPDLKTDAEGVATWKGLKLMTSAGPCTAPMPNAAIN